VDIEDYHLARLAENAQARFGDRESLFFEGRWYTYLELHERSRRLAGGLVELGIRPGDRVAIVMSNGPEVRVCHLALWRAGAVVVPLSFLLSESDLHTQLEGVGARAVITSPELLRRVRAAAEGVTSLRWVACSSPGAGPGVIPLTDLETAHPVPIVPRANDDLAVLLFTAGTTGRAKGVMLSHENLWICARGTYEATRQPGIDRLIVPLSLSHAYGLVMTIASMHAAEPWVVVLQRWFEPVTFLELVQAHHLQVGTVLPSMLQALCGQPLERYDLSSLRVLITGAAPLPLRVVEELERRLSGLEVREGYGCVEAGGVISATPPGQRRLGSVGKPLPGCEVRILDDQDQEVPVGETGEICCRSQGVMLGYWRSPELTARALRNGWLHTGDIGRLDEDGYLWIIERKEDLILRGGIQVFPSDVEQALLEHPAVAAAGVVGRPDARLGEEIVAFVALHSGRAAAPAELIEFARSRVGGYRCPREVHVLQNLPLTPAGRVDRRALRTMVGGGRG
jgi:long-chain acyl-CoA synthetase